MPCDDDIDIYTEMFTTDIERVQYYVDNSTYGEFIDPRVIIELNTKAHELSEEDFNMYTCQWELLPKVSMMKWYQNIIDRDRRIDTILDKVVRKVEWDEDDVLYLSNWSSNNLYFFKSGVSG